MPPSIELTGHVDVTVFVNPDTQHVERVIVWDEQITWDEDSTPAAQPELHAALDEQLWPAWDFGA